MNWKLLFSICFFAFSCKEKPKEIPQKIIKESLEIANKKIVAEDKILIENYVKRRNWEAQRTGTGLTFFIYKKNKNPRVIKGEQIQIVFSLSTLQGKTIFGNDQKQKINFIVEKDNMESGIHEVVQKLGRGERAFVILPPHLAFGLTGTEQIPPYSILVYDIEVN